ncbi:MAG: hypothetical protein DWQ20_00660 [Actinobacteria bacterium]|nr:MAG: hypothetical protein DWQ20_00660 [Actinomycetota bacterium]
MSTITLDQICDAAAEIICNDVSGKQRVDMFSAIGGDPINTGDGWRVGWLEFGDLVGFKMVGPPLDSKDDAAKFIRAVRDCVPVPHTLIAINVAERTGFDIDTGAYVRVSTPAECGCENGGVDVFCGD